MTAQTQVADPRNPPQAGMILPMRIELRDRTRKRLGRLEVDPARRPTRARTLDSDREVFLSWESALDDAGQLRRCVHCGCRDLYKIRTFPQLTVFVVILAFAGAVVGGVFGLATNPYVLVALLLVLLLDVAALLVSRFKLVCYACHTTYTDTPIARHFRRWERATADRHPRRDDDTAPAQREPIGEHVP